MNELEVQLAFNKAAALLGQHNANIGLELKNFVGLKAVAKASGQKLHINASKELLLVAEDVAVGLGLSLLSKVFRRQLDADHAAYVNAFKEFASSEAAYRLFNAKRTERNLEKSINESQFLSQKMAEIIAKYGLKLNKQPRIRWSQNVSKRRLGLYDDALNCITITKRFSNSNVPEFVINYVIFHELLHAKFDLNFNEKHKIHPPEFKEAEKRFEFYCEAKNWIKKNFK